MPLLLQTPQSFKRHFQRGCAVFHGVIEIDKAGKGLLVRNLLTGGEGGAKPTTCCC